MIFKRDNLLATNFANTILKDVVYRRKCDFTPEIFIKELNLSEEHMFII